MDTSGIVVVIIKNMRGNFFVHQRAEYKKTFPNLYGLGIGGHIKNDESHKQAAVRELEEEAGLKTPINYLFSIKYKPSTGLSYNIYIYETLTRQKISTFIEEWQWSGWIDKDKLDELQDNKELCPDTALFYQKYKLLDQLRKS